MVQEPMAGNGNGSARAVPDVTAAPPPNIGGQPATPTLTAASTSEMQAVVAAQMVLITTQAIMVRDLETQLNLAPPLPSPAPPPPGPTVNLDTVIDIQTAAIRTQAAYLNHLQDLQTALAG